MQNFYKEIDDPTRCDNLLVVTAAQAPRVPLITAPVHNLVDPVCAMARRPRVTWHEERAIRSHYCILDVADMGVGMVGCRDIVSLQDRWDDYLQKIGDACHQNFWRLFLSMHTLSGVAIDSALKVVKNMYVKPQDKKKHPSSRRQLFEIINKLLPFWPHVMHTHRIDVSRFNLPSGTKEIVFKFLDPIWAWVIAARKQHPLELHWKPVAQRRGMEVYGGGIQYGKFFKEACRGIPPHCYPMCMGLHWDGAEARRLSSSPICVAVGNSNSCKSNTQFCIGYMPHVPDEKKPEWAKQRDATEVKFFIRQQCASAILRIMEEGAKRGVRCRLLNQHNDDVVRLLFPRLSSMNFDQPEAQLFFGLQNKLSCSRCKRRKGYSAFRSCREQVPENISRLYKIANQPSAPERITAREKLYRWGFNWKRECCLRRVCDRLLVRIPGRDEMFPCLDYRDRMHGLVIFLHRMLFTLLADCGFPKKHRRILDERLGKVCERRFTTEDTLRKQRSIFTDVGMSATDKAIVIFLLPHVIGHIPGDIFDAEVYHPLATAVAQAQLMLIAVRGRRSYSKEELDTIFNKGFLLLFGALESVREIIYVRHLRTWAQSSNGHPPKRFKRVDRYLNPLLLTILKFLHMWFTITANNFLFTTLSGKSTGTELLFRTLILPTMMKKLEEWVFTHTVTYV